MNKEKPKRILLVDDEKDLVDVIRVLLESKGYQVSEAYNGIDGLEKAKKEKPDLILLDVMMPGLNGYQVCRELKKDPKYKTIPIVMLTAKAQESDRFWGVESGADDYLTKPFEAARLLETLEKIWKTESS
ncbi:MAG: hypothetical protein A2Z91_05960 [Deltaproteobacteria bacterium GWA2_38_16]|nr:MAG: hypothetical protein A2Z91_05960 [Deltaproteobacteria bacterium GWA2_38_16]OGQ03768.1 MAG: hypothetical protein A3D19_02850 [Deltaproteobacteria bacterium RIFCSPHIGHO2_02_FULL_38_15]OGQ33286.1 MAG: hypothetical protein A3A72_02200 [Deltaproteobacteria bacterium RIFCSPLOWO2_01_FULL_38_9]OGQ60696.1 MAG: hypothetical protein A3G92_02315 [Deltaproteobacteria bacterium RIFCSPLOWO2_12_FULL_38_8]